MRRLTILLLFIVNISFAQDLIITTKGDSIKCNFVRVDAGYDFTYFLKYKSSTNKDSTIISINFKKIKSMITDKIDILNTFKIYNGEVPIVQSHSEIQNSKYESNNLNIKNITAGDELIIHANHQYTGLILSLLGSGISIAGSFANSQPVIFGGSAVSLVGVIYFIESIGHIKMAGKKLNHQL